MAGRKITKSTDDKSVYCKIAIGIGRRTAIIDPTTGMKLSIKVSEPNINALDETINEIKKSIQSSEKFKQSFQIINLLNEIKGSSLDKFLQSYKQRQASFDDKNIFRL